MDPTDAAQEARSVDPPGEMVEGFARHSHEEELQRREARLAETQAIARVASWEWNVADDSITWSPEFYELLGIRPGVVEPTLSGFLGLVHPDDERAARGAFERVLAGSDSYEAAHRLVRSDGAERLLLSRGRVVRATNGSPLRIVGASLDLTAYMGIANELRSSHDQLVAAESVAQSGSFEWDIVADRLRWSEGMFKVFGLGRDDFPGTPEAYFDRVHPDDREVQRRGIEQLLRDGGRRASVYRIRRGDGATRTLRADESVECDSSGAPRRLIGVLRDITEEP